MDILAQYQKEKPAIPKTPQQQLPSEHGFLVRLVMYLSGGRIQDARHASYVLIAVAAIAVIVSITLSLRGGPPRPLPENMRIPVAGPHDTSSLHK